MASKPEESGRRRIRAWIIRLCVSALLLAVIFTLVPFADVWAAARQISPLLWIGALGLFLAGHAAAAAKARLAVGSVADRLIDTLGLVLIACAAGWIAWRPRLDSDIWMGWPLLGLLAVVAAGLAGAVVFDRFVSRREPSGKLMRLATKVIHSAAELVRSPGRLLLCLAISMAVQCLFVGINIAFAEATHIEAPVAAWFFAWTTAKIIAIAPISLGGLGLREASMAALLVPFGADPAQVVAIGLVWQSVLYVSGLIGFLVQLQRPAPPKLTMERS
jgi:uncharacterized membrane protein YbhN (UPF0104 family)